MSRADEMKILALALLFLCACPKEKATFMPLPRSLAASTSVIADANAWAAHDPERYWLSILPTGSMKPFVDEHSLVLCVRFHGQVIPNGSVAIFNRGDVKRVIHVVSDQNEDSVYMSGYANSASDGWYPKSSVEGIMVGQLYLP